MEKIIRCTRLEAADTVLEIGPGQGAITRLIAPKVKRLIAVEKDARLAGSLQKEFDATNVEIVHGDILKFPLHSLTSTIKVIGNLPYHISTPIIEKLITERESIASFHIMLQKEYAQRLCAASGSKEYGALSCFLQYHADVTLEFLIAKGSFRPSPKVDSAFLTGRFYGQRPIEAVDEALLFKVIRSGFGQRRKTLENALKGAFNKESLHEAAQKAKIDLKKRAEELSLDDFVRLSDGLAGD
jgi:16S rRNA (adenine1518-N6/adenine1519-N6)-dimethyltransferase